MTCKRLVTFRAIPNAGCLAFCAWAIAVRTNLLFSLQRFYCVQPISHSDACAVAESPAVSCLLCF